LITDRETRNETMAKARKIETMSNFTLPAQIKTGSQVRNARREGNVGALTRAQAQRLIAGTDDGTIIAACLSHGNGHVAAYAAHKLFAGIGPALASLSAPTVAEPTEPDFAAFNVKAWTPEQARTVLTIMAERALTPEQAAERIGCTARRITDWSKKLAKLAAK